MKNSLTSASWNQLSYYIFCLYPLVILTPFKSLTAIAFALLQFILIFSSPGRSHNTKLIWFPLLCVSPYIFYLISLAYSDDLLTGFKFIERITPLIVFPWLFYFNKSRITKDVQEKVIFFYIIIVSLLVVFALMYLVFSDTFTEAGLSGNAYYIIRTKLESTVNSHPTYFSLLLATGILGAQYNITNGIAGFKYRNILYYGAICILTIGLIIASSKMIIAATFVSSLFIWAPKMNLKTLLLRVGVLLCILSLLVVFIRPLNERVTCFIEAISDSSIDQNNPDSMRKAIYKSSKEAITDNIFWGTGIGDQQTALNEKYKANNYNLALERSFNTHNQYLQVWLACGIIPFILFILLILTQLLIAIVNKNHLYIAFIVLTSISFFSENILTRQDGIFLYAFFSSLFAYASWSENNKVYINGRYTNQPPTGVQRFAKEITTYLIKQPHFIILTPTKQDKPQHLALCSHIKNGQLWEQVCLPLYLRLKGSPLLLNLCNAAPLFYKNQIITIHDMAFKANPDWFSGNFVRWYNFLIPTITKKSLHVLTVSEFSKNEIIKYTSVDQSKITVVHNGIPSFDADLHQKEPVVEGDYVLSVGTLSKRKNQSGLIKAFLKMQDYPLKLVIAGQKDSRVFGDPKRENEIESAPNIVFIENPDDSTLYRLYYNASFTIYIPYYEGFGLPVVESLFFQKPVIVSDIPVFRELFSDFVCFLNPKNYDDICSSVKEMYQMRNEWVNKIAAKQLSETLFSYQKSASTIQKIMTSYQNK